MGAKYVDCEGNKVNFHPDASKIDGLGLSQTLPKTDIRFGVHIIFDGINNREDNGGTIFYIAVEYFLFGNSKIRTFLFSTFLRKKPVYDCTDNMKKAKPKSFFLVKKPICDQKKEEKCFT